MSLRSGVFEGRPLKPPKEEPDILEDDFEDLNVSRRAISTWRRQRYPRSSERRYAQSDLNVPLPTGAQRIAQRSMSTPNVSTDSGAFEQYNNPQPLLNTHPGPGAGSRVPQPSSGDRYDQDSVPNASMGSRSHVQQPYFAVGETFRGGSVDNYRSERWPLPNDKYNQPRSNSMQHPSSYGLDDAYNTRMRADVVTQSPGADMANYAIDTSSSTSGYDASGRPVGSAQWRGVETLEPETISPRGSLDSRRAGENDIARNDIGNVYDPPYAAASTAYPTDYHQAEHPNNQRRRGNTATGNQRLDIYIQRESMVASHEQDGQAFIPGASGSARNGLLLQDEAASTYSQDNQYGDFETAGDTVTRTGLNLRRSLAAIDMPTETDQANPFQEEVKVWQDGYLDPSPALHHVILLVDTRCDNSNWVAERIVTELRATKEELPHPAEFTTFNGESMTTIWKATLSFRSMGGVRKYTTDFLVAVDGRTPFDMALGHRDILTYDILPRPRFFGLSHKSQDNAARMEEAARIAEQERRSRRHEERVRQMEEQRRRDELARRNEALNQGGQNNGNNGNNGNSGNNGTNSQNNWNNGNGGNNNQAGQNNWNNWNGGNNNQGGQGSWNNGNNSGWGG